MSNNQEFADFEVQIDLSGDDVRAWGGEQPPLPPPGDYVLRVINVESKPAKSSQQPMVVVQSEIVSLADGGDAGDAAGGYVWNNYSLSPKALGRLKSFMIACNGTLSKFQASEYLGVEYLGTIIHTEGQAQPDAQGNVKPARTFANVINERALEAPTEAPKAATKPPVTRATGAAKNGAATAGGARRA